MTLSSSQRLVFVQVGGFRNLSVRIQSAPAHCWLITLHYFDLLFRNHCEATPTTNLSLLLAERVAYLPSRGAGGPGGPGRAE